MRRDYFSVEVEDPDASGQPTVRIDYDGPSEQLVDRLTDGEGEPLAAEELDVSYRLHSADGGVLGVANRVTGEFVLELNADPDAVFSFVRAARDPDEDRAYRLVVAVDDEVVVDHEKRTFLVYGADGELRRSDSLIPSGVEL